MTSRGADAAALDRIDELQSRLDDLQKDAEIEKKELVFVVYVS